MTTALPSVHRGGSLLAGTPSAHSLPPQPGPSITVNSWATRFSEEGKADAGSGGGAGGGLGGVGPSSYPSVASLSLGATGTSLASSGLGQMQLPTTPEGLHRYLKNRVQAAAPPVSNPLGLSAANAPYPAFYSPPPAPPSPSVAPYTTLTVSSPPRSPDRLARQEGGSGGADGGDADELLPERPCTSYTMGFSPANTGRMIGHDSFISRPTTSNQYERMRLFTGTSQGLRPPRQPAAAAASPAAAAGGGGAGGSGVSSSHNGSLSLPATPSYSAGRGGSGGGFNGSATWRGPGSAFGSAFASLQPPSGPPVHMQGPDVFAASLTSLAAANAAAAGAAGAAGAGAPSAAGAPAAAVAEQPLPPGGASGMGPGGGRERSISPRPHNAHPAGPAAAAVALLASGQHAARHAHASSQGYRMERLVALDVEQAITAAASPKAVATLTPGSLDGMGHPVLIAADGSRIHRRINQHLPGNTASRMQARGGDWSFLEAAAAVEEVEVELDAGEGDEGLGGEGFAARPHTSPVVLPRMGPRLGTAGGLPGNARGGGRLRGAGGGGPGAQGGGGGNKLARCWSSPMRNRRFGAGNGGGDGAGGTPAGGGGAMLADAGRVGPAGQRGPGLIPEGSVVGRGAPEGGGSGGGAGGSFIAATAVGGVPGGSMRGTSSGAPPPAPLGADASPLGVGGAEMSSPRNTGGLLAMISPANEGPLAAPKWLGMYIPKEDPLGLWTGKRMSKTEVVVEKRLFAMRHNPAMRMELEGRASDALKERAAAQAEVAAVSRAREEEAAARKAQLKAEVEARRRGLVRSRSRSPGPGGRGLTREAKAALERQLLMEAASEPRGPLSRDEAAAVVQATWRMYVQRRAYLRFRETVIKIQRVLRLRYCVVRVQRRHRDAAQLLLDFLIATAGTRQAAAAMDLREIHSNYIRRKLLEKKGDLRHNTRVAVLVREWETVEGRILALGTRGARAAAAHLRVAATAAVAASGFAAAVGGGGGASGAGTARSAAAGGGGGGGGGSSTGVGVDAKELLAAVAGDAKGAAHGTRLLGKALEARKKGVMLVAEGNDVDLNKQLTVDHVLAHVAATDRVILESREPVPGEVKGAVAACYLEHKSSAYTALIGIIWLRRARWRSTLKQQQQLAMARSVVATGSAWQAMDELALEATVKAIGPLPTLPRMRVTATLRELRALMQAGVQEAALFTAYMVKGGIHELEKRLHSELLMRTSFGRFLAPSNNESPRESFNGMGGAAPGPSGAGPRPRVSNNGVGGNGPAAGTATPRRRASMAGTGGRVSMMGTAGFPGEPGTLLDGGGGGGGGAHPLRASMPTLPSVASGPLGGGGGGGGGGDSSRPSASSVLAGGRSRKSMLGGPSRVRIDPLAGGPSAADLDTISEAGTDMSGMTALTGMTNISTAAVASASASAARARFMASQPSQKAGVAQLKERWWREAVVRLDATLKKRYKLNAVSLVVALEDRSAPNTDLFAARLAEIHANPEKADALMAALPGAS
ncbi:hypothetical protein HYH02_007711 [Chlamydomonas schloesseri]|uniref:Uncharacterized protein n=1 Tax=Chlamydomonas schloesseri TaxID=2026947 RepID=A0A836B4R6_9CHLO|nr:hypothetical protein HYH02_007711 [Chlamydomonas schloesseri]|eukprot:KAG2447383.1 hypothetical protein HYH02_007711 [Chlamydomonas schloesseri]